MSVLDMYNYACEINFGFKSSLNLETGQEGDSSIPQLPVHLDFQLMYGLLCWKQMK